MAEQSVLVLQGGGALGAYQAGVYQELAAGGIAIDWIAGISIGAINAAIIAGNPPEARVEKLDSFWNTVSSGVLGEQLAAATLPRALENEAGAAFLAAFGVPGFFSPRLPAAPFQPPGSTAALSLYDTSPLRRTLETHVDFARLNDGQMRLSVGAVHIPTGNFAYFDNRSITIGPEHIMASGALPPGFPPVEIDGELYWDGGLVSNTPLDYVMMEDGCDGDTTIFQVDLFSARGELPKTLLDVAEREKDIRYSSRTRFNTDVVRRNRERSRALLALLDKLPPELKEDPNAKYLAASASAAGSLALVHLIYRSKHYETQSKDYLFSRRSVREHWAAGRKDAARTLRHPDWVGRRRGVPGIAVYDLTRDEALDEAAE
ncbi:MAG: patatin-like phospholipase family protein [Alphaproteobacteria bacterium]|nr:patatin-like phospholipase family protein [Alphaproteobacteria bacterium]MDE2013723.1 patatin-like phospholipase family protein [Alphaproteobacteria bacterium]